MAGHTYGDFCNGCPNDCFCDWPCPIESCEYCYGKEYCDGKCNNQVSDFLRYARYLKNWLIHNIPLLERILIRRW